ncbi:MAG: ammonium transporter [Aeromicrobium sp.]|uniref:ammonium transporter n=1 Tax=Aeromicrobium sp. TaxID=1871063 RepID=UPI0039E4FF45
MSLELAWLLICAALVIFMTPGLAFFYGGLVKAKSVVAMMMLSFGSIIVVALLYTLIGAGIASQNGSDSNPFFGNPFSDFALRDTATALASSDPESYGLFAGHAFLVAFCIITVALVSGAVADRAKFWPWMLFAALFSIVVVFPTFRWLWGLDAEAGFDGWLANDVYGLGAAFDWAGGTVIHQSAGAAALALALVLGKRKIGFSKEEAVSHNVPLVLIGAAILWFGWFGFNTGVHGGDVDSTGLIFFNTLIAPAAAAFGWIVVEKFKDGKSTAVGAASGIVAGLVAITPACAALTPLWAIILGLVSGAISALAIELKFKFGFDDSLDVVGIHLVAGFIGCVYIGLFGTVGVESVLSDGKFSLLGAQVLSSLTVIVFSFVASFVIALAIEKTIGFRVKEEDEIAGIDSVLHGEGYALD